MRLGPESGSASDLDPCPVHRPKLVGTRWYYRRRWRSRSSLVAGGWLLPPPTRLEAMAAEVSTPKELNECDHRPVAERVANEIEECRT